MELTIARCMHCKRTRLVDRVKGKSVCLACKQKLSRMAKERFLQPISV
ncbi:MAG: hypothetical protein HZB65_01405 [Candidatus Aenigmarchaeota archaeon]|nr:hypothetical protein [Candidatus Aenigmarchaeota archaeon]